MFGVDIIVQIHTAEYRVSEGEKSMQHLVDDLPTLYRNYFMGVIPWRKSFIWDLYSAIPWGRIGCAFSPPPVQGSSLWKAVVFLVLNLARMFKMYRLPVVMNMVDKATFIKLLLQLFTTVHYISCAYFRAVVDNTFATEHDPDAYWLDSTGFLPRTENNWAYEYVTTLYWVVTTMSTVGYGDILPRTTFERAFTMCIMIGGVAFFATITGTITEIISARGRSAMRFQDFMEEVEEFIKVTEVPKAQKQMMLQFFELKYPDQNIFHHDNIISQVPKGLRRQLLRETFGPLLNQVPLFCAISETSLLQLCGEMEIINCIPNEQITIEGREPDSMFVVRHGHVQLFKGEQMLQRIGPGNMFGEIAIMGLTPDGRRWRSSQSVTQVELLQLKKERFAPILLQNADIQKRFRTMAARQIERLRLSAEQGKQRIMWDPALNISISNWQLDYVTEMEEAEYSNKDVVWDLKQWSSFVESDPGKNNTEHSDCEDAVIVHILCVAGLPTFRSEDSTVNFEIRGSWNSSGKVAPGGQDCTSVTLCPTKRADSVAVRATICVPVHHQPVQEQEDKRKKKRKGDYVLMKFVYISTEGSLGPVASSGPINEAGQAAGFATRKCALHTDIHVCLH
jgi:CRP-like cAMP-binding protein